MTGVEDAVPDPRGVPDALRTGQDDVFAVYAIRYADRLGRRGQLFSGYDECSELPHEVAYYVWLALSASHTVLVDAGLRPEAARHRIAGLRFGPSPLETLDALGVPAHEIPHVVLTHLHYDHTGLVRELDRADVFVQWSELAYWTGPVAARINREHWLTCADDLAHVRSAVTSHRVRLTSGDTELMPGVSVHWVGGHTAGMQVVRVRTAHGWLVLASDASHFYENLETDRPPTIVHCTPEVYAAFDRLRALADAPELVVPGHDPRLRPVTDGGPPLPEGVLRIA